MPCYKDEKTGKWYVQFYYTDFTGVKKQKRKRGFETKREAQEWEREFQLKKSKSCDMTLSSFVELYFTDMKSRLRDSTIDTKRQIFDTKIVPYSHASLCIELGYSALLVAKRLGDTVPVVMKTYAHLYPNKQAELVSKLEDLAAPQNENEDYLGSL